MSRRIVTCRFALSERPGRVASSAWRVPPASSSTTATCSPTPRIRRGWTGRRAGSAPTPPPSGPPTGSTGTPTTPISPPRSIGAACWPRPALAPARWMPRISRGSARPTSPRRASTATRSGRWPPSSAPRADAPRFSPTAAPRSWRGCESSGHSRRASTRWSSRARSASPSRIRASISSAWTGWAWPRRRPSSWTTARTTSRPLHGSGLQTLQFEGPDALERLRALVR